MSDWLAEEFPRVAASLVRYKLRGTQGRACCPNTRAHVRGDRRPSLLLKRGDNGGLVFCCRAGCPKMDVLGAMGLTWHDVCHDRPFSRVAMKTLVKVYDYRQEGGTSLYQVLRYACPKDFRPRRRMPGRTAEWLYMMNAGSARRVPSYDRDADPSGYKWVEAPRHTPDASGSTVRPDGCVLVGAQDQLLYNTDLLVANPRRVVFFCEGEKDADTLLSLGFLATTVQGGSQNRIWPNSFARSLRHRHVVFLPDHDACGLDFARWYAGCCLTANARSVTVLKLPHQPEKGDVSDWVFRTGRDTAADALRSLVRSSRAYAKARVSSLFGTVKRSAGRSRRKSRTVVN